MDGLIKLYRPEDLVERYVLSWHITDKATIEKMQILCQNKASSLEEIVRTLDTYLLAEFVDFTRKSHLPTMQILALMKMIFTQEKLYEQADIFNPGAQKKLLYDAFSMYEKKYAMPSNHTSEMTPQIIRVYNPLIYLRHTIKKAFHYVFKNK